VASGGDGGDAGALRWSGGVKPAREGHGVRSGTGRRSQIWRKGSGGGSSSVTSWSGRTMTLMELVWRKIWAEGVAGHL
jgi:hypothetical protein